MYKDVCLRPAGLSVVGSRGFSLIELLVTLSLVSILLFVAAPSMTDLVADSRVAETRHRVRASLALARSEAIRRSTTVTLCASVDSQSCEGRAKQGKYLWSQLLLFKDSNADRMFSTADQDELIRVVDLSGGGQVLWNRGQSTIYASDGSLSGSVNGSFYIFDAAEMSKGVRMLLQLTGRLREADFSNKDIAYVDQYLGH